MECGTMNWRKKIEKERQVKFICLECGTEENIPRNVVVELDELDDGDNSEPPRFQCENCGGPMIPEDYTGVAGIRYTFTSYKK